MTRRLARTDSLTVQSMVTLCLTHDHQFLGDELESVRRPCTSTALAFMARAS